MQITVSGKHIDVGSSLREHIETRLGENIPKYLDRVTDVRVVVSKEANFYATDIHLNTGTHSHIIIKGRAEAEDPYACFNTAAEKIEKQLRRYKRKLKDHQKAKPSDVIAELPLVKAKKFVLVPEQDEVEKDNPVIIAEKHVHIEKLSVGEAVMRMDLQDLPALMFINGGSGRINLVYKRADGNISWVDPEA